MAQPARVVRREQGPKPGLVAHEGGLAIRPVPFEVVQGPPSSEFGPVEVAIGQHGLHQASQIGEVLGEAGPIDSSVVAVHLHGQGHGQGIRSSPQSACRVEQLDLERFASRVRTGPRRPRSDREVDGQVGPRRVTVLHEDDSGAVGQAPLFGARSDECRCPPRQAGYRQDASERAASAAHGATPSRLASG